MLTHKELDWLKSLQVKKDRDQEQCFLVDNPKVISEHNKSQYFKKLYVTESASLKYQKYWANTDYTIINEIELKKISPSTTPQGAIAVFAFLPAKKFNYTTSAVLLLDGIQDPGNVGTILRTADWFGVKNIFLNSTCADIYNPKTIASSMGSIFNVKFYQNQNLLEVIEDLKKNDYKIIASDSHGQDNTLPTGKLAIIIGSEAHGISAELMTLADQRYQIKGHGQTESLNAAVATGIILYQINSR
ncbi:MAG: RNA methyltransferase [Patescibacteria group bacterium]